MNETEITSPQNPRIKSVVRLLEKSQERKELGRFVVEGTREIERALACGYRPLELYLKHKSGLRNLHASLAEIPQFIVSDSVFGKIAYRESGDIVCIFETKSHPPQNLKLSANPLILILESVEKPGNIGAMLRTADGAGADAVIICDPRTDLYNPNVVRASAGTLFSMQIAVCDTEAAVRFLKDRNVNVFAAALQDSAPYDDFDFRPGTAFVMGKEDQGLSEFWRMNANQIIRIPMLGISDSLNVSVTAGVLLYEALRQRNQGLKR